MKLTYFEEGFFPFRVPEMDSSFASSVGAQTVYPAGFSLDQAMQIYWRAQDYGLSATGSGVLGEVTQALTASGNLPARNAAVDVGSYELLEGFVPTGPGDLTCGRGLRQTVAGLGTITASGPDGSGTNPDASLNLLVNLFYPEVDGPGPVVKYDGLWWPAMSVSCAVTNTVDLDSGGSLEIEFDVTSLPDPSSTVNIGTFTFFGTSVAVYCTPLAPPSGPDPAETRSFSGALTVAAEWP